MSKAKFVGGFYNYVNVNSQQIYDWLEYLNFLKEMMMNLKQKEVCVWEKKK